MNAVQQLEYAKSCYQDKNYPECVKCLLLARRSSDEAKRYYALLLDEDQRFRETVEQFYYLQITGDSVSANVNVAEIISEGRLLKWQHNLLDLTFRNKFLNFRETRLSIPLLFHEPSLLEDQLAAGKRFAITALRESFRDYDFEKLEKASGSDPIIRHMSDQFSHKMILSPLSDEELYKRLLDLARQTKHDLEESGVGTLFLSIGILTWPGDDQHRNRKFRAPILLLPMKLTRKSAQDRFTVERSDEDTVINITLLEKLSRDWGIAFPEIGIDHLPEDNSGVDVALILQRFRDEAAKHDNWKVTDEVWLSSFSFEKFIMWNDLKNRAQSLLANPLVNHLVNNPGKTYDDSIAPVLPEELDRDFKYSDIFAPLSADSSQLSAILSAARGKTFVLHGPPGTGKSQTITNIIAECLAIGKSVLFVAEKRAALEVVYNRLSQLGLEPFCLELHSNKSGKQEILEQFRKVIDLAARKSPAEWDATTRQLETEKRNLNEYVNALHMVYPIGLSPYQAICFLIAHPETFPFSLQKDVALISQNEFEDLKRLGRTIAAELRELPDAAWEDFRHIECQNWTPDRERNVRETAGWLSRNLPDLTDKIAHLCGNLGLKFADQSIKAVDDICALAEHLASGEAIPGELYDATWQRTSSVLKDFIPLGKTCDDLVERLRAQQIARILSLGRLPTEQRVARGKGNLLVLSAERPLELSDDGDASLPEWANEFFRLARRYVDAANALAANMKSFFDALQLSFAHFSEKHIFDALPVASLILEASPALPQKFFAGKWAEFAADLRTMIASGRHRDAVRAELGAFDLGLVFDLDTRPIRQEIEKNQTRPKLFRNIFAFFICGKVKKLRKDSKYPVTYDELPRLLDRFDEYAAEQRRLNALSGEYESRLGELWNRTDADWELLDTLLQWGDRLHDRIAAYMSSVEERDIICDNVARRLSGGKTAKQRFVGAAKRLAGLCSDYAEASDAFFDSFFKNVHGDSGNARGETLAAEFGGDDGSEPSREHYPLGDCSELLGKFVATHARLFSIAEKFRLNGKIEYWWSKGVGDWEKLRQVVRYLDELDLRGNKVCRKNPSFGGSPRFFWAELLHNADRMLFLQSPLQNEIGSCCELWREAGQKISALRSLLDLASTWQPDPAPDCLEQYAKFAAKIANNCTDLRYWCLWRKERENALAAGLDAVVRALEAGSVKCAQLPLVIEHIIISKFCDEIFSAVEPLRDFLGSKHEDVIRNFQVIDEKYADLSRRIIISKLAERLPGLKARRGQPIDGTPLGVLQRELSRQRGHKPVRRLLEDIKDILFDLKPCFLMSPLSVAQFLPASSAIFDVVIFDEASQIPMEDAVGAIARGKQLIVAGDPKQLPPTIFFKNHSDDDSSEDNIVELESLLQECLSDGFYQSHLLWHYRSRDESLISFSNAHYYDNSLWTFPAPTVDIGAAVHFHYVENGVYHRTGSRTNPVEAETVVREVVKLLQDPGFNGKSLGIVTFSTAQQTLIEDMLDEERRRHPDIEKFFDPAIKEPVFVKNLENVQGDERDVIFFSICYGRDPAGTFLMYFGPLNVDKGERRLNVAITRAKEQIVVFSSVHADEFNLSNTTKNGARDLRDFIAFAESGVLGCELPDGDTGEYAGLFEEEVAKFLQSKGYRVEKNIGRSAYKIDLAVVSPDHPDRFVLGITCDGDHYRNTRSARDRDKLRVQILEQLGWKLCHVWSPSWWEDRDKSEKKLLAELEDAIKTESSGTPEPRETLPPDEPEETEVPDDDGDDAPPDEPEAKCGERYPDVNYAKVALFQSFIRSPELFYDPGMHAALKQQAKYIVFREAPIVESLLQRRLAQAWGFNRIGSKILQVMNEVISRDDAEKQADGQFVFWSDDRDAVSPEDYKTFRCPGEGESGTRSIDQIPLVEIKNAMLWFLTQYHAFSDRDALFRGVGHIFGIKRLTESAKSYYALAYDLLEQEGLV